MSAKEVVEAAADEGIILSEGFVYNIRSNAKSRSQKASVAPTRASRSSSDRSLSADEAAFRALVVSLGTARASELVEEVEEKLASLVF